MRARTVGRARVRARGGGGAGVAVREARMDIDEALVETLEAAVASGRRDVIRGAFDRIASRFRAAPEPFPVKRPAALGDAARRIVAALARARQRFGEMRLAGLPQFPDDAARVVGIAPPIALDDVVTVEGATDPAWCLLYDAMGGLRAVDPVIDAVATLEPERAARALGELARGAYGLGFAPPLLYAHVRGARSWEDEAARALERLALRVGDAGVDALWRALRDLLDVDKDTPASPLGALGALVALERRGGRAISERLAAAIVDELAGATPQTVASEGHALARVMAALPAERAAAVRRENPALAPRS